MGLIMPGVVQHLQDRSGLTLIKGDVNDLHSLVNVTRNIDVVYHLAAITSIPDTRSLVQTTFLTNSNGTLNVLLAAHENKVQKIVYVSTCHVYGLQDKLPISEQNTPHPNDIYSASKLSGELLSLALGEMYGMDITISRAFNHYGPRQRKEFLIPSIILQAIRNRRIVLGDPTPTRDYTFVEDVVEGYILIGEKGRPSETYNLCTKRERTIEQIVNEIVSAGNFDIKVKWNPGSRKVDIPRSVGSYEKARTELGWSPKTGFTDGLRKTIDWLRIEEKGSIGLK